MSKAEKRKRWRYFFQDGSMRVNTRIDGYNINEEGIISS